VSVRLLVTFVSPAKKTEEPIEMPFVLDLLCVLAALHEKMFSRIAGATKSRLAPSRKNYAAPLNNTGNPGGEPGEATTEGRRRMEKSNGQRSIAANEI